MKVTKEIFFEAISTFDSIPFVQSIGWYNSIQNPNTVFYIDSQSNPNIGFWGVVTEHRVLGRKLIINGFARNSDVSQKQITNFFREIIDSNEYDIVYLSDIEEASPDVEIALRRSGFKRPLALSLCPMSISVDTTNNFNFHRNWKRQVTKSINAGNIFEIHTDATDEIIDTFINLFNELKDRKSLGFVLSRSGLKALLETKEYFISLIRAHDGTPRCGRITYIHNHHTYDIFAANSNASLKDGAIYQNQQQLFEYLRSVGAVDFDYGRIPPGRDSMDNIYLSKSLSGGRPIIYNGEWEYVRSNIKNWLYYMYRFCIHKSKRY